jgi:hypothetical protein
MQALAILMNAISCPGIFNDRSPSSADCVKQLVRWLRVMRSSNMVAGRAYEVLYSIVKTSKPHVWADIADAFPDEITVVPQQPASGEADPQYIPWPGQNEPTEALVRYEVDSFGNYHCQLL